MGRVRSADNGRVEVVTFRQKDAGLSAVQCRLELVRARTSDLAARVPRDDLHRGELHNRLRPKALIATAPKAQVDILEFVFSANHPAGSSIRPRPGRLPCCSRSTT